MFVSDRTFSKIQTLILKFPKIFFVLFFSNVILFFFPLSFCFPFSHHLSIFLFPSTETQFQTLIMFWSCGTHKKPLKKHQVLILNFFLHSAPRDVKILSKSRKFNYLATYYYCYYYYYQHDHPQNYI